MKTSMRIAAAMLLACVVALVCSDSKAFAAQYQVWSCTTRTTDLARSALGNWFAPIYGGSGNHCPDGLEFEDGASLDPFGPHYVFEWNTWLADSKLSKITLTMKGGDTTGGVVYEVMERGADDAFATLPSRAPGDSDLTTSVSVPEGVKTIAFRARCTQTSCTGSPRLRINEIKFRLDDSAPPELSLSTWPQFNFTEDGGTDGEIPWFRSISMPLAIGATDDGSGTAFASLDLDGSYAWNAIPDCTTRWEFFADAPPAVVYDKALICDGDLHAPSLFDLRGKSEGRHMFELTANDAMENASPPLKAWFGIDDTPPEPPTNFRIVHTPVNKHGWTTDPFVAAQMDFPPARPSTEAPLRYFGRGRIVRDDAPGVPRDFWIHEDLQPFPSEGHFRLEAWYVDDAGNRGHSAVQHIGYDTTQPPAAMLHGNEWVSRDLLIAGYRQAWDHLDPPPDLESGICGYIVAFDKEPLNKLAGEPTISGNPDSVAVPANLPEGQNFIHVATVSCAGVVANTADAQLRVDASDPEVEIEGLLGGEWSRTPLNLTLTPTDELSGPEAVHWSLDEEPTETASTEAEVAIGDGVHELTTYATDKAGNESAPDTQVISVDSVGPTSWISRATGGRPNEFTAHVQDLTSGLDSAALQYRRIDAGATPSERDWRQSGAAFIPGATSTDVHTFRRSIDDSVLADGEYELQVVSVDRAGNRADGSMQLLGGTARVVLPLRARPVVALTVADVVRRCTSSSKRGCVSETRCRRGKRCTFDWVTSKRGAAIDRILNWGDRGALAGSVLLPDGTPLGGVRVSIHSTPHAGTREFVDSVTTAKDGTFEWRIPGGPSRSFTASTTATENFATATNTATLAVRAELSLTASDRNPRPGQKVRLRGQLASRGMGVPSGGKQITIEYWRGDKWAPAIDAPFTDDAGRFHTTYPVPRGAGSGKIYLRAHAESLPTENLWPFEGGKSPTLRLKITR
jgi:hypothetical protein